MAVERRRYVRGAITKMEKILMNRKFNLLAAIATVMFAFVFYGQASAQADNKVAVIFTDLFMDKKAGIAKFIVISDSLNR